MTLHRAITVFGAYGHTGRFVVSELRRRGWAPVLAGRDAAKLSAASETQPGVETRVALIDDPATLDRALSGAAAVINCAGPFIDTAAPLVEAALRAGIPYLDIAAEQSSVLALFDRYAGAARDAGVAVIPAMAFYGGLGDLLATATMGDWASADEISVAVALDSWKPTRGTRLTGERNHGPRFIFSNHRLEKGVPPPPRIWHFPVPFGSQEVVGLQLAETITISRHLETAAVRAYINLAPLTPLVAGFSDGRDRAQRKRGTTSHGARTRYLRHHRAHCGGSCAADHQRDIYGNRCDLGRAGFRCARFSGRTQPCRPPFGMTRMRHAP
jgi:Saccharopine dehydrogenase NADP binding domain